MKENTMSLEQLEERKAKLEARINDLKWMEDEAEELAGDLKIYFLQPLTILNTQLRKVKKEIDHWYDF